MTNFLVPVEEVLIGAKIEALPAGCTWESAVLIIKAVNTQEQTSSQSVKRVHDVSSEEFLGLMRIQLELFKREIFNHWDRNSGYEAGPIDVLPRKRDGLKMSEEKVPIEKVLTGATVLPLEPNEKHVGAIIFIKTRDDSGVGTWSVRRTGDLSNEEILGMLEVQAELVRDMAISEWYD